MDRETLKQAVVEFIGPFALVFAGVGAIIATQGQNLVAIALAHGLAIGLMICAVGHISGGQFNPAVTVGLLIGGRITAAKAVVYVIAQLLGAVAAAGVLTFIFPALGDFGRNNPGINNGVPAINPAVGWGSVFLLEVVLTFFLMFVIYGVAVDGRSSKAIAGLVIGLTITMDILAGGVISGAVMNPARAFGPALIQQDFRDQLVWWVGPLVGAALASVVYNFVLLDGVRPIPSGPIEQTAPPPGPSAAVAEETRPRSPRSEARRRR